MVKTEQAIFHVSNVRVENNGQKSDVFIVGQRSGRPSKRFTINTSALKIDSARITSSQKNKTIEHSVTRINYLPTKSQTRIHTASLLFPGEYKLNLTLSQTPADSLSNIGHLFI